MNQPLDIDLYESNADQAAAWNGAQGAAWVRFEREFHSAIREYGDVLIEAAAVCPGDHILDVGCGMGDVTRRLASSAPSGRVLGLDISDTMLSVARARAKEIGQANVQFMRGDAQTESLPPSAFDIVVSRFGVMFFSDAGLAFANLHAAAKPDAQLVMITWQPLGQNEWNLEVRSAVAEGRELPVPRSGEPGPFGLSDPNDIRQALEVGGWHEISVTPVRRRWIAGADIQSAFVFLSQQSSTASMLAELADDQRQSALEKLRESIVRHDGPDGVVFASAAWLIHAVA